jgi:hypothetical protein
MTTTRIPSRRKAAVTPCADQRGLAAPRPARRRRGPELRPAVAGTAAIVGIPTEDTSASSTSYGLESPVRAHRARLGQRALHDQRRILPQDRLLQGAISGPGSSPSSRSSTERSWRRVAATHLDGRTGTARWPAAPTDVSRSGASATNACALARTLSCWPARRADSTYNSSAVYRSSVSRAALDSRSVPSVDLGQRPATATTPSASASTMRRPLRCHRRRAARAPERRHARSAARRSRPTARPADSPARGSRLHETPSSLRSRTTHPCTILAHDGGSCSPPHTRPPAPLR